MADETVSQQKPKKIRRIQIGLNVVIQIGLILFLAAMVNYLGFEHYKRWDLSRDKKYALSDKTKRFLESMKGKMRITVFFSPSNPIAGDVQNLLTEYQYAGKGKIDVENVDPERNLSRERRSSSTNTKWSREESLLILDYEGRNKTVKASEMAEIDQGNPMFGEATKDHRLQGRTGDHQRADRLGRRKEEHARLRPRATRNRRSETERARRLHPRRHLSRTRTSSSRN